MSSFLKGLTGAASSESSCSSKGGRSDKSPAPQTLTGFLSRTQDKNKGGRQQHKPGHQQQHEEQQPGFKQKMMQYGMDVQSQREAQRKEQDMIEKKMGKRGQKTSNKADLPENTSKVKILTSLVGKSK